MCALQSFHAGEYTALSSSVSRLQSRFKLVSGLDINNGIRQPIRVIYGTYAEAMAPDPLLGMGLEYLIFIISGGVGEVSFEELVWVNALSCHLFFCGSRVMVDVTVSDAPHRVGP